MIIKKIVILALIIVGTFSFNFYVLAQSGSEDTTQSQDGNVSGVVQLTNPLPVDTPQAFIGQVINGIFGIIGSLALLMFIYGGLTWMTSSGNQEKIKKGRDIIVWSMIGLAIIFSSYALVRFVIGTIGA